MNSRNRFFEIIKDIIIVLLIISAVFLGWKSRLFGNSSAQLSDVVERFGSGMGDSNSAGQLNAQILEAAKPLNIVVTKAEKEHYGVKYDMDEIRTLYSKTALIFGEAFGYAQAAGEVSQAEWREALTSCGVYFEYMSPVKLSVIDGWYGAEISGDWKDISVRRLCVADAGDKNRLYFQDADSGSCYAADVADDAACERLAVLSESIGINSTFFAFEIDSAAKSADSCALLKLDVTGYPVVEADNPLADKEFLTDMLFNLGISDPQNTSYTDFKGTHYVDEGVSIRMPDDSTLIYRLNETETDAALSTDESEAIELARAFVADTIAERCGSDADVYFDSSEADGAGGYTVFFDYVVAGGVVHLSTDVHAASVKVSNGAVTEMELYFRSYTVTGETVQLLREIQAAVASKGAYFLCYPENGSGRLEPVWLDAGAR